MPPKAGRGALGPAAARRTPLASLRSSIPLEGFIQRDLSGLSVPSSEGRWRRESGTAWFGDPGLRMHDVRHTVASLMIASGAGIEAAQRRLGHTSAATTLDLDGPVYDDELQALADVLEPWARRNP